MRPFGAPLLAFARAPIGTPRSLATNARDFGSGLPLRSRPLNASTLQLVVWAVGRRRQRHVGGWSRNRVAVLVDLHAQAQAHGGENLLDFIQRLAAEIFRLQHFSFGLLHQLADGLDI